MLYLDLDPDQALDNVVNLSTQYTSFTCNIDYHNTVEVSTEFLCKTFRMLCKEVDMVEILSNSSDLTV